MFTIKKKTRIYTNGSIKTGQTSPQNYITIIINASWKKILEPVCMDKHKVFLVGITLKIIIKQYRINKIN